MREDTLVLSAEDAVQDPHGLGRLGARDGDGATMGRTLGADQRSAITGILIGRGDENSYFHYLLQMSGCNPSVAAVICNTQALE